MQGTPPVTGLPGAAPSIGLPVFASTFAAIAVQIGSSSFHASLSPPGMSEGPKRAPSSPPETPEPMNRRPFSVSAFSRRIVSSQCALPPSMMMSPASSSGTSPSITASVGPPALTRITILRGRLIEATKSFSSAEPISPPPASPKLPGGFAPTNSSILEVVRL